MKARIENNQIVVYPELPIHYSSETLGTPLVDFRTMPNEIHESEGFFYVVTPDIDPFTQKLGVICFDEDRRYFTYPVEQLEVPLPRPLAEKRITKLEFVNRFTSDEFKAIIAASKVNADIELWMMKFNLATYIDLNSGQVNEGLQGLEAAGLIGAGRANEIIQNQY